MDIQRAISFSACPARFKNMSNVGAIIEVLGASPEAIVSIELQIRQALTDQQLRKEILQKSDPRIQDIVEAVIAKVTGN